MRCGVEDHHRWFIRHASDVESPNDRMKDMNSVWLGSYPATAVHRVKRPHLISQKTHLFLAAAFTFTPAAVGHGAEGDHSILGVPDHDLANPPACRRPFVWLGLKPKKSVPQRVLPPPAHSPNLSTQV